ncbi:transglutaminase-like domain-containing protein [Sulfurimonas sp. HSL-3221]|uniref:transglutaminase-like domain-containing protein n=1 Tax=Sulfurimonadaceae TaxID=2771471 RepID=UPI001E31E2BA|nr:transglutaminase-like domain-containing protein [Sulfurimonas sp. HSL-3221]UFS63572.1 transglutaminase-like domain-containing protein [Sulfurimonas sp. HSL-3221]
MIAKFLRTFFTLLRVLILLYVPLFFIMALKQRHDEAALPLPPPQSVTLPDASLPHHRPGPRAGEMQLLSVPEKRSARIPAWLDRPANKSRGQGSGSQRLNKKPVAYFAYGRDLKAYYANGFFKHFIPFSVDSKWSAMHHISRHMHYVRDEQQFKGYAEIWLSSEEAYLSGRGDCEDHAILLADWLEGIGYDARVVFGTYKNEGHAWVVVFEAGNTYLLEATAKRVKSSFPLASALPNYHPKGMFNDRYIWYNYGSPLTTAYTGGQWIRTARFRPVEER